MAEGIGSDPRRNGAPGGGKGMVGELALLGFLVALVPFVIAGTVFWGIYAAACLTGLAGDCLNVNPSSFDPSGGGTRFNGDCKPAEEIIAGSGGDKALKSFRQYLPIIEKEAARRGLPVGLISMQILKESAFDPTATSRVGAGGLYQIMPDTFGDLDTQTNRDIFLKDYPGKSTDRYGDEYSIFLGALYLKQQHTQTKSRQKQPYDLALAAYNAGLGRVQEYGYTVPPFEETQNYVKIILENWAKVQACEEQLPTNTTASSSALPGDAVTNKNAQKVRDYIRRTGKKQKYDWDCSVTDWEVIDYLFPGNQSGPMDADPASNRVRSNPPTQAHLDHLRETLRNGGLEVWHINGEYSGQHWIIMLGISEDNTLEYYDPTPGKIMTRKYNAKSTVTRGGNVAYFGLTDLDPWGWSRGWTVGIK